jgi:hypothetical protein
MWGRRFGNLRDLEEGLRLCDNSQARQRNDYLSLTRFYEDKGWGPAVSYS